MNEDDNILRARFLCYLDIELRIKLDNGPLCVYIYGSFSGVAYRLRFYDKSTI